MLDGVTPFPPEFAARYRDRGYWQDRSLASAFAEVCAAHPDRLALVDGEHRATFAELDTRSTALAANLLDLGLRPRDRIVVQLTNTEMFGYLYLALQKIGVIPILALPSHRAREVDQFVDIGQAVACAAPARRRGLDYVDMLRRVSQRQPGLRLSLIQGATDTPMPDGFVALEDLVERRPAGGADPSVDPVAGTLAGITVDPDDPAVFQLSGGTAGVPRLIPRSHNDYLYNSRMAASVCDVRETDVLLAVLPVGHNLPLACPGLQGFWLSGATVVMCPSTASADVLALLARHRVTHLQAVPALIARWVNDPAVAEHDLGSVRVVQSGGQRLDPDLRTRAERVLPSATVQETFCMAEGLLMFTRLDDDEQVRQQTSGRPVCPDDEIRLVDADDNDVPPGDVGELVVRGPCTPRGYFRAPEHNARAFTADGFYRSGDLLRLHPSGNYVVEGRKKELINRGGEKINAAEIEDLLLTHPDVRDVACVPVPDQVLGERMCACVAAVPGRSMDLGRLVSFLASFEIASHKLPERVEMFDALPRSASGRIDRPELARLLARRR